MGGAAVTEPTPSIVLLLLAVALFAWAYYLERHWRARHEERIERGIESGHLTEAHRSAPTVLVWGTAFCGLVVLFAAVAAAWR